jgi:hypothetical protein
MLVLTTNDSGVVEGGAGAVNVMVGLQERQLLKVSLSSPRSSFFELLKTRRGGMLLRASTGPAASI